MQLGYLDGDIAGNYFGRRDLGMAPVAEVPRRVDRLVARGGSVGPTPLTSAREHDGETQSGRVLGGRGGNRYYPIGFYIYKGVRCTGTRPVRSV